MLRDDPAAVEESPSTDLAAPITAEFNAPAIPTLAPEKYVAAVYQPFKDRLACAIDSVRAISYDITTGAGMKTAIACRAAFRDLRVEADKERKVRKAPILQIGKLLESGFDSIEERVTPLEEMFDADIKAEEDRKAAAKETARLAEEARVAAIRAKIAAIQDIPACLVGATADALQAALSELARRDLLEEDYAEFLDEAQMVLDVSAETLVAMRNRAREREAAEAERVRLLAEEKARNEAAAEANRVEAARLAQVAQEALEAQQERDRLAAEAQRQLDAQAAAIEAARKQQEADAAAALAVARAAQERRAQAMADIRSIQQLGELDGARAIFAALDAAKEMDLVAEKFGDVLDLAQMTRDMTVVKLEQKLAAAIALAHGEALELNAEFDRDLDEKAGDAKLFDLDADHLEALEDDALRDAMLNRAAVAAKLPVCYDVADEEINAGAKAEVTGLMAIDLLASEFGWTRKETHAFILSLNHDELAVLVEAED